MALAGDSKDGKEVVAPAPAPAAVVPVLRYGIGYFDQIKERNSDDFVSMSLDAGAEVERGVYAAGIIYEKGKFSIGAIDYYSDDIINIAYGEMKMELPFSADCAAEACPPVRGSAQCRGRPPAGQQFFDPASRHQSGAAGGEGALHRGFHSRHQWR